MTKHRALSRNKMINYLHNVSGKSYKECRTVLKVAHWKNMTLAELYLFRSADIIKSMSKVACTINEALIKATECVADLGEQLSEVYKGVSEARHIETQHFKETENG